MGGFQSAAFRPNPLLRDRKTGGARKPRPSSPLVGSVSPRKPSSLTGEVVHAADTIRIAGKLAVVGVVEHTAQTLGGGAVTGGSVDEN
jgi:hypothetical protein